MPNNLSWEQYLITNHGNNTSYNLSSINNTLILQDIPSENHLYNDISIIVLPLYSPSTIFCASSYSWKKIPLSCLIKQDLHLSRYLHRNRFRPSWLRNPSPHFRPHLRLGLIYFALAAP